MGHETKIYKRPGGNEQVVANEGKVIIQTGGSIVGNDETQAAHIATPTDLAECITAITAILVVLESVGLTADS
jgi:hypothetical protein